MIVSAKNMVSWQWKGGRTLDGMTAKFHQNPKANQHEEIWDAFWKHMDYIANAVNTSGWQWEGGRT